MQPGSGSAEYHLRPLQYQLCPLQQCKPPKAGSPEVASSILSISNCWVAGCQYSNTGLHLISILVTCLDIFIVHFVCLILYVFCATMHVVCVWQCMHFLVSCLGISVCILCTCFILYMLHCANRCMVCVCACYVYDMLMFVHVSCAWCLYSCCNIFTLVISY